MRNVLIIVVFLCFGCTPKISQENISLLEGYWVIEEALAPNGESRPYLGVVEVDYFQLSNQKGIRKKITPTFGNQLSSTNDELAFSINFTAIKCYISYSKGEHDWQEEIITLTNERLELKDSRGVVFRYKRYLP